VNFNEKQIQIIEAAEKLFSENGFDGTSVRDIAEEAGVNLAMISYYFGSKEKLMESIFKHRGEHMKLQLESMIRNNQTFFVPWESIHEANPQEILDRKEKVALKPFLIMQGALDNNMLPAFQTKFVDSYRAAGGSCDYTIFEGCEHEWVAKPGPDTDRAHEMAKAFIARQVNA